MDIDAKLVKLIGKLVQSFKGLHVEKAVNEVFVTDLSTCQVKKRYFDEKAKDGEIGYALRGNIVHDYVERFFMSRGFRTEVPIEKDFGDFVLRGRIDVVFDGHPLEIKSSRSSLYEYFLQTMIYAYMMGVDYGYVLIIDNKVYLYRVSLDGKVIELSSGESFNVPFSVDEDVIRSLYKLYKRGELIGQMNQCVTCPFSRSCIVSIIGDKK